MSAVVPVTPGSTLYVYVGGGSGGSYNGGGAGYYTSGGGGTDLRTSMGSADGSITGADTRLVVAGGGIGGGCNAGGGGGYYGGGGGYYGGGGGSSHAFSSATVLSNSQGDSRCTGSGALYITPVGLYVPSAVPATGPGAPSQPPTRQPTARPSLLPTPQPTYVWAAFSNSVGFAFTGNAQSFVVPEGVTRIQVDACGGQGGYNGGTGGLGGFMSAVVPVTPGSTLYVYVGGGSSSSYNGGGAGSSATGGGGTDLRTSMGSADGSFTGADTRLVVAGGGGGGDGGTGGAGGGLVGQAGQSSDASRNGQGGSQTGGGAGSTTYCSSSQGALWKGGGGGCYAGGGGGYYGGGGGYAGGGGSSYAVPAATVLFNGQGDQRCTGPGALYITPVGLYAPSAVPTTGPGAPSQPPTRQPTPKIFVQSVFSSSVNPATFSYTIPDATFRSLYADFTSWYLTAEVFGTGWGSSDPRIVINMIGTATTSLTQYCNPGDSCGGNREYPDVRLAGPTRCVMNYLVTPAVMNIANGGSIVLQASTVNVQSTYCKYQGSNVYITYTLSAYNPQPSYAPTPAPSAVAAGPPPTLHPTLQPTSPSPAPSALPTPVPSAAPSFFPTYQSGSTVVKNAFSSTPGAGSAGFVIPPVVFTNLLADAGRVWYLRVEALPLGWGAGNYATFKIIGATGLPITLTPSRCYPGNACTVEGDYPQDAVPTRCIMGWKLLPSDLDPAQGGSLTVTALTTNFQLSDCTYASMNVYLTYTLTAGFALPTYFPTAAPSAAPTVQPLALPSAVPTAPTPAPSAAPSVPLTPSPSQVPSALPSASPTMRSDVPTPDPTARPTMPTAAPTAQPTALPSIPPSALPTPLPTSRPSPMPSYAQAAVIQRTASAASFPYTINSVTVTNMDAGQGMNWFVKVEVFATGYQGSNPFVLVSFTGASPLGSVKCYPFPSVCDSDGLYPLTGAAPFLCATNFLVQPSDLDPARGGSLTISATAYYVTGAACPYKGNDIYLAYTLSAAVAMPTLLPTARPSAVPTTAAPSTLPTAPSARPSPEPTTVPTLQPTPSPSRMPSALPSANPTMRSDVPTPDPTARPTMPTAAPTAQPTALPTVPPSTLPTLLPTQSPTLMPSYAQAAVIQRTAFAASLPYTIPSVTVTNMNAGQGMSWFVKVEVFATGYQGSNPFVLVSFTGASPLGSVKCYPFPSACGADGLYPLFGAAPFLCATNFPVQASDLEPARGGSLTISATAYYVTGAACPYKGNDIYLAYTLSAAVAMPTLMPTARPSAVPTTAVPSTLPTRPSARPSPEPTTAPSAVATQRPTVLPSPEPSAQPTHYPTYNKAGGLAIPAVFLGADASSSSGVFEAPPFAFTNLDTKGDISEWFLNVDVYATGLGPNTIVSVTLQGLTGAVSGPEADRDGRELGQDDTVSANTFVCTPPADAPCPADRVPVAFRCPAIFNLPIPAALLAAAKGGTFSVATSTQLALNKASCPFRDQGRRFDLYVRYSLSAGSSPTPEPTPQPSLQPTTAAPNLALLIASQQQAQGLNDVVMNKGAPMYAVGGGAALFALVAMLLYQVRDQGSADASTGRQGSRTSRDVTKTDKNASMAVVKLNLVATIVGSALTGAAFVSECFLIQLLFANRDTAGLGYVAFLGRLMHIAAAVLVFYLINKSKTKRVFASVRPLKPLYSTAIYKANLKLYGVLFLLSMCDVTLLRFLPWRDSQFARETSGYPSPFVFLSLVYTKLLQSVLTVSCQAMLLMQLLKSFSGGAFPPSLAFLVLNMAVTVAMLLVNLLEAGLRTGMLSGWAAADDEDESQAQARGQGRGSLSIEMTSFDVAHAGHFAHASSDNPLHGHHHQDQHLRRSLSAEHRIDAYEGYTGYSPDVATWDRRSLSQSEHEGQGQGQGQGRLSGSAPSAIFDHTVAHMHHGGDVGARPGRLSHGPASSPALARLPPPGAFSPSFLPGMASMAPVAPGRIDISKRASLAAAPLPPMLQPRAALSRAEQPAEPAQTAARPSFSRPQSRRSLAEGGT